MPDDVHAASGAFALSALPEPERLAFERHLEECADCRREVREFRAVAAELAGLVQVPPPPSLRTSVLAAVAAGDDQDGLVDAAAVAVQQATRDLLGVRTREDVVDVVLGLVERLGGWVVPADLADDRALPLDIGLGSGAPLLPAAEPGSGAIDALEQYLPQFVEDARQALTAVVRRERDARHEAGDGPR